MTIKGYCLGVVKLTNQPKEEIKLSHLIASFSFLGVIALVCIFIWQKSNSFEFVLDLFDVSKIIMNLAIGGGLGLALAVIAIALVKGTGTKIPEAKDNEELKEIMMRKHGALIVGILPGIFEEVLFRGFVLPFIQHFTNAILAIILTTIVFWAIHLPQYKTNHVLNWNVILLSLVTSILFVQTETLWASIFAHMVYNYIVTIASQKKIIKL
jgi:membrane protease YdiL (CAAX protease family)